MARYTGPSCRLCRREGIKLFLKADRCYSGKCAFARREYAPGQHGQRRKKNSEYALQLREKQKARRFYGVLEKQFRKYFEMAMKSRGVTGLALLQILESRFDNVVCRLGLGSTRAEARQLIKHSHFTVNGKKVNIPSYLLSEGDVIEVRERSKKIETIKAVQEDSRPLPSWLEIDKEKMLGKVVSKPGRDEIDLPVKEHYIIELYSKN